MGFTAENFGPSQGLPERQIPRPSVFPTQKSVPLQNVPIKTPSSQQQRHHVQMSRPVVSGNGHYEPPGGWPPRTRTGTLEGYGAHNYPISYLFSEHTHTLEPFLMKHKILQFR